MASSVCTVGFEPTVGFDALAEIQGPEVDSLSYSGICALVRPLDVIFKLESSGMAVLRASF